MTIVLACVVAMLLGLQLAVVLFGLRSAHRPVTRPAPPAELRVTVVVPVKGGAPRLDHCLRSLAEQKSAPYRLFIVTESAEDAAAPLARALSAEHPHVEHLVAGRAERSGQKNHNLLAGIAAAPDTDVFVTSDADILPGADWLARLCAPLADSTVQLVTTHQLPSSPESGIAGLAGVVMLRYLHALSAFPGVYSVWGGSTAYRATLFDDLGLKDVWRSNVVDDVSAAAWASGRGLRRVYLGESLVPAPALDFDFPGLYRWFLRQTQFQQHCSRPGWVAMFVIHGTGAALLIFTPVAAALACVGYVPWALTLVCASYGLGFAVITSALRRLDPEERRGFPAWCVGALAMVLVGTACLCASLFTSTITWSGRRYRVGAGGRVEQVDEVT